MLRCERSGDLSDSSKRIVSSPSTALVVRPECAWHLGRRGAQQVNHTKTEAGNGSRLTKRDVSPPRPFRPAAESEFPARPKPPLRRRLPSWVSQQTSEQAIRLRLRKAHTPSALVVGVYRRDNAAFMRSVLDDSQDIRLWALDESAPHLERYTVGVGPGARMDLLNLLIADSQSPYTVIVDDDIVFERGSLSRLLQLTERYELDLCQAAQSPRGYPSHSITIRRRFSALRLTNFVEIGPLLVIGPRLREQLLPFPEGFGMGIGLDVRWSGLHQARSGHYAVVDAVVVRHLKPTGLAYDKGAEAHQLERELMALGLQSLAEVFRTFGVVRPWNV